jgi:hypothetical protein
MNLIYTPEDRLDAHRIALTVTTLELLCELVRTCVVKRLWHLQRITFALHSRRSDLRERLENWYW